MVILKNMTAVKSIKIILIMATLGVLTTAPYSYGQTGQKNTIHVTTEVAPTVGVVAISTSATPIATPSDQKSKTKTRSQEHLYSIVSERVQILHDRWEALALRFDVISERIASRVSKLKKDGRDTTRAEVLLEIAKLKIETARERSDKAADKITERADESDGTVKDLRSIENDVISIEKESVRRAFQESKDALVDTLNSL